VYYDFSTLVRGLQVVMEWCQVRPSRSTGQSPLRCGVGAVEGVGELASRGPSRATGAFFFARRSAVGDWFGRWLETSAVWHAVAIRSLAQRPRPGLAAGSGLGLAVTLSGVVT